MKSLLNELNDHWVLNAIEIHIGIIKKTCVAKSYKARLIDAKITNNVLCLLLSKEFPLASEKKLLTKLWN